jgi:Protein of unknown function (DUF3515)
VIEADPTRRQAARVATLVAVPVALVVGLLSLWRFGAFDRPAPAPPASAAPTSPVSMPAAPLAPEAAEICRVVVSKLPESVNGSARRPVTAGAEQNAAYGEPPLTLACGTAPASYGPTDQLAVLGGVCWYQRPGGAGTEWTTVDRKVPVTVIVPGPVGGSAQWVIPFSAPVAAAQPQLANISTGCH